MKKKEKIWLFLLSLVVGINLVLTLSLFFAVERIQSAILKTRPLPMMVSQTSILPFTGKLILLISTSIGLSILFSFLILIILALLLWRI